MKFDIMPQIATYDGIRPHGATTLVITSDMFPGNAFGLWLPETIVFGDASWCNADEGSLQEWEESGGAFCWQFTLNECEVRCLLRPDPDRGSLIYEHTFVNRSKTSISRFRAYLFGEETDAAKYAGWTAWPESVLNTRVNHPLIIMENQKQSGAVGIAAENFKHVFHNGDPRLHCLHSEPFFGEDIPPGERHTHRGMIIFSSGDFRALLKKYEQMTGRST